MKRIVLVVRCIILLNATETQDISFFLIYVSYFSDLSRYTEGKDELVRESLFRYVLFY